LPENLALKRSVAAPWLKRGEGVLATLIAKHDWAANPLGPIEAWPNRLQVIVELMLNSCQPMLVAWGPQRNVIYNDAYLPIMGERHPNALGLSYLDIWPEAKTQENPLIEQVYAGAAPRFEDRESLYARGGVVQPTYFTFSFTPLFNDDGTVAGALCISEETTQRVLATRRAEFLSRLDAMLRDVLGPRDIIATAQAALGEELGASRVGYGDVDDEGILFAPGSWTDGHASEGLGRHDLNAFGQAVLDQLRLGETLVIHDAASDPRVAQGKIRRAFERLSIGATVTASLIKDGRMRAALYVHSDGPRRWTASDIGLIEGAAERTWSAVERAQAESEARAKESLFATFAEAMPNHVWAAEPSGRPEWFNAQSYEYTGKPDGTLSLDGWREVIHPDDRKVSGEIWREAVDKGEVYETRFRIRRHDGVYRWFLIRALPIRGPDGTIERWIGSNTDIEDERQNAAALAELNVTLEERVAERTREVEEAQAQLRQAQKMEAVGQLTGGIAHDFNNLLQGIVGSLDMMQKRIEQGRTGELERFVSGAMTSANRAAALTHRLLAFSRRQPLDPKTVRINPLVASMEDLVRRSMSERIKLELVLSGGLWTTLCDPNQLESAVLNLCINARDAMPDGGQLTIETCNAHLDATVARRRDVPPGQYVCVSVTDTGTGMPPDVLERAIEPFFTTKPIGQGTGLGLSMVYGFARQSEGEVRLYSEVGVGTTVKLYLPRKRGAAAEEDQYVSVHKDQRSRSGETVLVVEDEPVVRGLVVEVLSELGYQTIEASDGPAGLDLILSERAIDLLITDIGLPGLNGRQLADAAREKRPGLKVMFMTGYAENAALASGFLEPGMEMITKPFAMEIMAGRVREMMAKN